MFKNPFSFRGRVRRTEFALSFLIYIAGANILGMVATSIESTGIIFLGIIPLFWFYLAQAVKRCQDRGNHGIFVIIPFYIFWMLFADSDHGNNKYGPNPKGIGNVDEIDEIGSYLEPQATPVKLRKDF